MRTRAIREPVFFGEWGGVLNLGWEKVGPDRVSEGTYTSKEIP